MKIFSKALVTIATLASVNAAATQQIQIDCEGDGISIAGTLSISESSKLSGLLEASGEKVPSSISGTQNYSGTYTFVEAGKYYKNFDYEVVAFKVQSGTDIIQVKSYVALDGSLVQTAHINAAATEIACKLVGPQ